MRKFNKLFVIALPRCATVSVSDAVGILGIKTAHLGRIYGESTTEHNNPSRLIRMHEQISQGDYHFDIFELCDGLADYPACCFDVLQKLDKAYPGSLFINVRRDADQTRWLQSVERQFVGLQLLKTSVEASETDRKFMQVVRSFREMTFGQADFDADAYAQAYRDYQQRVSDYFAHRRNELLDIDDIHSLEIRGFDQICDFLECPLPAEPFPCSNTHSELPSRLFMQALDAGEVDSQTGIKPVSYS